MSLSFGGLTKAFMQLSWEAFTILPTCSKTAIPATVMDGIDGTCCAESGWVPKPNYGNRRNPYISWEVVVLFDCTFNILHFEQPRCSISS